MTDFAPRETLSASAQVALKPRLIGRKHEDVNLRQIHERLVNWAAWSRMRFPGELRASAALPTPDEPDALVLEAVMCALKASRPDHWRAIKCCYRYQWADTACAEHLGVSTRTWKDRLHRAMEWTHAALEARGRLWS